jgi:hypothetical protein
VLSKKYVEVVKIPLVYVNFPENSVIVSNRPDELMVKTQRIGYALVFSKTHHILDTLFVDGNYMQEVAKNNHKTNYILVKPLLKQLMKQNEDIVQDMMYDTLFFKFEPKVSKTLAIASKVNFSIADNHIQNGKIKLRPMSIKVSGPKSVMDTMKMIYAKTLDLGVLDESVSKGIFIPLSNDHRFELSPKSAIVNIEVDKMTEYEIELPVSKLNVPKNLKLRLFPETVKITYLLGLTNFKNIQPNQFSVYVDYLDVSDESNKLTVKIAKQPESVVISKIKPSKVEFIIKK